MAVELKLPDPKMIIGIDFGTTFSGFVLFLWIVRLLMVRIGRRLRDLLVYTFFPIFLILE
jgi:hypothetical protein